MPSTRMTTLLPIGDIGRPSEAYGAGRSAARCEPLLLALAAMLLLLVDALISLGLRGYLRVLRVAGGAAVAGRCMFLLHAATRAPTTPSI